MPIIAIFAMMLSLQKSIVGLLIMLTKLIIIVFMIIILITLASGLIFLVKDEGNSKRTVKALSWRIGLSLGLFLLLMLGFALEWITPHPL